MTAIYLAISPDRRASAKRTVNANFGMAELKATPVRARQLTYRGSCNQVGAMSENASFLPRVTIETTNDSGTVSVNFRVANSGIKEVPKGLEHLFSTLEDWTSFCIASIQHMPVISSFGHFAAEASVKRKLIDYLKSESISHEEMTINEEENRKRYSFIIHEDDVSHIANELSSTTQIIKAAKAIQRSHLSALVAEFDFLFHRCLRAVAMDYPEKFVPDETTIPIGKLRAGKKFSEWEGEKINTAIDEKLRGSHKDFVDWVLTEVAKLNDLSTVKRSPFYRDFIEICQRRHLLIHNGGTVNSQYIENCKDAGFADKDLPKIGDVLDVDPDYLRRSAARVYLIGAFTMYLVAQKVYPSHSKVAHQMLLSASHDFLVANMTKMAERIINFAEHNKKIFDNDLKLKFAINLALCKLFEPNVEEEAQTAGAIKVLESYDWSVTNPIFDLALACAKRDFSQLIPLAKAASSSGLSYRDVRHFVVFKEARRKDGFMECFPKPNLLIADRSKG